jgi:hypothetical protein
VKTVQKKNALEKLKSLNRTYSQVALKNPTYYALMFYALMFERPIPDYRPIVKVTWQLGIVSSRL